VASSEGCPCRGTDLLEREGEGSINTTQSIFHIPYSTNTPPVYNTHKLWRGTLPHDASGVHTLCRLVRVQMFYALVQHL
jgi:hypothetical protein